MSDEAQATRQWSKDAKQPGDQIVKLFIVTPDSLNKKQRQLFQELADTLGPVRMPG